MYTNGRFGATSFKAQIASHKAVNMKWEGFTGVANGW